MTASALELMDTCGMHYVNDPGMSMLQSALLVLTNETSGISGPTMVTPIVRTAGTRIAIRQLVALPRQWSAPSRNA
jgi:hypothetical protein